MKKLGNVLLNIIIVIVVIFSLSLSVMVISSKATGIPNIMGYSPVTVQTDSMVPTFNVGDLLIIKKCDTTALEVGDIITFNIIVNDRVALNTHRIIEEINAGGLIKYKTQGDNVNQEDINAVVNVDVLGKYTGYRVAGVGKVLDFLKTQNGILVTFVIPLALLFIFQLYKFIMLLAESRKEKEIEAVTSSLEEEKEKAIEEYKAQQKAQEEAAKTAEVAAAALAAADIEREKQKAVEEYIAAQKAAEEAKRGEETPAVGDGSSVPDETETADAVPEDAEEASVVEDGPSTPDKEEPADVPPADAEASVVEDEPSVPDETETTDVPPEDVEEASVVEDEPSAPDEAEPADVPPEDVEEALAVGDGSSVPVEEPANCRGERCSPESHEEDEDTDED